MNAQAAVLGTSDRSRLARDDWRRKKGVAVGYVKPDNEYLWPPQGHSGTGSFSGKQPPENQPVP